MPLVPGARQGPYEILGPLGAGAFSTGKPAVLFQKAFGEFDVLPDGRFVLFDAPLVLGMNDVEVVENWFEELKRIAPVRH